MKKVFKYWEEPIGFTVYHKDVTALRLNGAGIIIFF
jgi:hypothetical protein